MMPVMDGSELCKHIKNNEKTCHIPFVMLTAKSNEENRIDGLNMGADYYISKPFNIKILHAQLESILQNRQLLKKKLSNGESLVEIDANNTQIDKDFLLKVVEAIKDHIGKIGFKPC